MTATSMRPLNDNQLTTSSRITLAQPAIAKIIVTNDKLMLKYRCSELQ